MIQWKFDINAETRLQSLIGILSPSMYEIPMASYLRENWGQYKTELSTDVMGNVTASLQGEKNIHIGLVAHMDTVFMQITKVCPNGLLQFRSIGLRPHVLLGQPIAILTDSGIVDGVIGFDTTSQFGQPKGLIEDDLWIDIGTSTAKEALTVVSVGDLAVLRPQYCRLGNQCISATGIDDRIGLFVIGECLKWFSENGSPLHIHAIGSVQEEIALRGAAIIATRQHLDACMVLDVDYATDTLTPHDNQMGEVKLGAGTGMHRKADNNWVLQQMLREIADEQTLSYQVSLGRFVYGGTDSASLQLQAGGVATMNLNIPCRYMHSPVEICHIADIESTVNFLIASINGIAEKEKKSFIPGID